MLCWKLKQSEEIENDVEDGEGKGVTLLDTLIMNPRLLMIWRMGSGRLGSPEYHLILWKMSSHGDNTPSLLRGWALELD